MTNGWTQASRARQASIIQRWKLWERSTGPRTSEGKARVSQNTHKGGSRHLLRALSGLLKDQDKRRKDLVSLHSW